MTEIESAEFVQLVNDKENAEFNDNRKRPHSEGDTPPKKAKIDEVTLSDDSDQQSPAKSEDIDCAKKSTPRQLGKSPHSSSRSAKRKEEQEAERLKKLEERQKAQEEKRHQQELKRQEREKKEREKEQKKREEEEKRKKREEEKEAKRLEEEEKRKKREEEKERKRQEEELKLAKKREEEQIRLAKKYEEELIRRAEEAKKQRQSNAFMSFFKYEKKPEQKKKEVEKKKYETWYTPNSATALLPRRKFLPKDWTIPERQPDVDYKAELIERLKTIPLVKASVTGSMKAKLFQFHSNYRPPYYGTWRKRPGKGVNGRRPLGKMSELDYDADSDADWEEEPDDAESCHSNEVDEDAENDDEEEDDEGFFVEPGYLSDGEGECPETGSGAEEATNDDEPADVRAARLAERARKWEAAIHRKRSTKLQPNVLGPYKSGAPLPLENLAFEIL